MRNAYWSFKNVTGTHSWFDSDYKFIGERLCPAQHAKTSRRGPWVETSTPGVWMNFTSGALWKNKVIPPPCFDPMDVALRPLERPAPPAGWYIN